MYKRCLKFMYRNTFYGALAAITFILIIAFPVSSDMIVTTHDGKTYKIPVNTEDVKNIEFTKAGAGSGAYIGCYKDSSARDLSGFSISESGMTTERCISICSQKGFTYAATQYSSWCFCDNNYGKYGNADNCDMNCDGNPNQKCGGAWANSVYSAR